MKSKAYSLLFVVFIAFSPSISSQTFQNLNFASTNTGISLWSLEKQSKYLKAVLAYSAKEDKSVTYKIAGNIILTVHDSIGQVRQEVHLSKRHFVPSAINVFPGETRYIPIYFDSIDIASQRMTIALPLNDSISEIEIMKETSPSILSRPMDTELHIGLIMDEKTKLSQSGLFQILFSRIPLKDQNGKPVLPVLTDKPAKSGYTLTGRTSWNDRKHFFELFQKDSLIKQFSYTYRTPSALEVEKSYLKKNYQGSGILRLTTYLEELNYVYAQLYVELSASISHTKPDPKIITKQIRVNYESPGKNLFPIIRLDDAIYPQIGSNVKFEEGEFKPPWLGGNPKYVSCYLPGLGFSWFPFPKNAWKKYYNIMDVDPLQEVVFDSIVYSTRVYNFNTLDSLSAAKDMPAYLSLIFFLHQFDCYISSGLWEYIPENERETIDKLIFPLGSQLHVPFAYYMAGLLYKNENQNAPALHSFYTALLNLQTTISAEPFEMNHLRRLIMESIADIYNQAGNMPFATEFLSLFQQLQTLYYRHQPYRDAYSTARQNMIAVCKELNETQNIISKAENANFLSGLASLATNISKMQSSSSAFDLPFASSNSFDREMEARSELTKNAIANRFRGDLIARIFSANDEDEEANSDHLPQLYLAKGVMDMYLTDDQGLRLKIIQSLNQFAFDKPALHQLLEPITALAIEARIDAAKETEAYVQALKALYKHLYLIEKAIMKFEMNDLPIPVKVKNLF